MKQLETKTITGKIVIKTGLHIEAGNEKIEIGGMDNPIIREPLTNMPYIPASSIKGKMRSLLEWALNEKYKTLDPKGDVHHCITLNCPICRVFGSATGKDKKEKGKNDNEQKEQVQRGPTRLIIRDAFLTEPYEKRFQDGEPLIEEKFENSINRITAIAAPRSIERITSGVEFNFSLLYKIIDTGDKGEIDRKYFDTVVKKGLKLLQDDYLGGSGSRGSGKIEFRDLKDETGKEIKLDEIDTIKSQETIRQTNGTI